MKIIELLLFFPTARFGFSDVQKEKKNWIEDQNEMRLENVCVQLRAAKQKRMPNLICNGMKCALEKRKST